MATKKPAKAPVAPVADEAVIEVGSFIQFNGYPENTPEDEQLIEADSQHEVIEVAADPDGNEFYVIQIPNPNFNPKKKVHAETNPETIETELFATEVTLVDEEPEPAPEEEAPVQAAPVAAAKGKGKAKAAAAEPAEEVAAAPAKGKGKATTKPPVAVPAAAKGKAKTAAAAPAPVETNTDDEMPDLENEDPDVLALVEESDDLIATAQALESDVGHAEFKLGGILYHIKKSGDYKTIDDGKYAGNKGFAAFVGDYLNVDYRKAQYLINIYVDFSNAGIENAAEVVAQMGWTKASVISGSLADESQEPANLIELANTSNVAELRESIKTQNTNVGGTKGEVVKRVLVKFSFFEDEGKAFEERLTAIMAAQGLKTLSDTIMYVLDEWEQSAGPEAAEEEAPQQAAAPATKTRAKAPAAVVAAAAAKGAAKPRARAAS